MKNQLLGSTHKLYPARFLIVGLFALIQLMTSCLLNTLTPIAAYLAIIYSQNSVIVTLGGLLFALMHPIFTFPAAFVIDTYGTRFGIIVGCVLGLIGVYLRLLVNYSFAWIIVGQVVAGIGRPFILNCQAKLSGNWFSAQKRGQVTQLLTLILNVSLIIGMIIPSMVFEGYEPKIQQDNLEQGKNLTYRLMFIEAIMGSVFFGVNILFQRNKPPTPPSESGNIQRQPFGIAISKVLRNTNYILLLLAFGCYFGIFNGISIVLSFLIKPWFGEEDLPVATAVVGGSPIISGIIGIIIIGPIQRKSGQFKKWILICMSGSTVAIALFYPLLETGSLALTSFISAFNSFFLIPLVPIMLQLGCELVFPVGEGIAVGLLFAIGNFFGFLLGLIMSMIVGDGTSKHRTLGALAFCLFLFLIGLALIIRMKEQKNREKAENELSEKRKSLNSTISDDSQQNNPRYSLNLDNTNPAQAIDNVLL